PTGERPTASSPTTGPTNARPGTSRTPSAKATPTPTTRPGSKTSGRSAPRTTTRASICSVASHMAAPPEQIDFATDNRTAVLASMDQLAESGKGWVNLSPALDEDEEPPPRSSTFGLFSGRGPDVPLCTWVPGPPVQAGIQHGTGTKAVRVLRDLGEPVPNGWRVTQDHSRRGLVVLI